MNKLYISILAAVFLSSCGSWSEDDVKAYTEQCMNQSKSEAFCTCTLEKVQSEFASFEDMTSDENQEKMAEILTNADCYAKQEEEKEAKKKK